MANSTFDPCLISLLVYQSNILVFIHVVRRHDERCRIDPVVCTAVILSKPIYSLLCILDTAIKMGGGVDKGTNACWHLTVIANGITYCNRRGKKSIFTCRPGLITLNVSHSVWMGVVAREEGVMAQGAEACAAWGLPVARFGGELQLVTFAATPLIRRHPGGRWPVWEGHLKQEEQHRRRPLLNVNIQPFSDKNRRKLSLKTTASLSEFISNKNRSWRLYLWEQPSTANCTDECCPCCQETWTKQETMASAHNVWMAFSIAFMGF